MKNPKVELIRIDGGGYHWEAKDDVGGLVQSETYKTEEAAWKALFANRVKWKLRGGELGCFHKRTISLMVFGVNGEGRTGTFCVECGKEIIDNPKEEQREKKSSKQAMKEGEDVE